MTKAMDASRQDIQTHITSPKTRHAKQHSTNPFERLNKDILQRTKTLVIFSNDVAIVRLVAATLVKQNDE